jgi:hypothetical protein
MGFLKPLGAAAGFSKPAKGIYIYLRFSSGLRKSSKNSSRGFRKATCSSPAALENLFAASQRL